MKYNAKYQNSLLLIECAYNINALKPFVIDFQIRLHILLMLSSYFFRRLKQMFLCELYNQITTGMSLNFRNHHMHIYAKGFRSWKLLFNPKLNQNATKEFEKHNGRTTCRYELNIWYDHCLIWLNAKGVLNFLQYFKIEFDQTLFSSFICLEKFSVCHLNFKCFCSNVSFAFNGLKTNLQGSVIQTDIPE